jgi:hypothetical protein
MNGVRKKGVGSGRGGLAASRKQDRIVILAIGRKQVGLSDQPLYVLKFQ